jgi:hypothetical protein
LLNPSKCVFPAASVHCLILSSFIAENYRLRCSGGNQGHNVSTKFGQMSKWDTQIHKHFDILI